MITTTYKCDRCSKEQPTSDQMWQVAICCDHYPRGQYRTYGSTDIKAETLWCRDCCLKFNLVGDWVKLWRGSDTTTPPPPPTFEDQLREIIRTIVQEEMPRI